MNFDKVFKSKYFIIAMHMACWTVLLVLPLIQRNPGPPHPPNSPSPLPFLWSGIFMAAYFYANAYFILPFFLAGKNRLTWFIVMQFFCFTVVTILSELPRKILGNGSGLGISVFRAILPFIIFLALSTAYRLILDKIRQDHFQKERENEALKTELSFLRSQISPHFIFNVLNSTVSLARKKSDLVEPTLVKLSTLMRYIIYESESEKVTFDSEIEYVNSYLELQCLRFADDALITFDCARDNSIESIEPMLIIPIIENAFKHGITSVEKPEIVIAITEKQQKLNLYVKNRFGKIDPEFKDANSGIGLRNLQRRLTLLYGNKFLLSINKTDEWFMVNLNITLG